MLIHLANYRELRLSDGWLDAIANSLAFLPPLTRIGSTLAVQRGHPAVLGDEKTIRRDLKTLGENGHILDVVYAQGRSMTQESRSALHGSRTIKLLLKKRNPSRLEQFLDFGIDEGFAQMCGVPIDQGDAPFDPTTLTRRQLLMMAHESELLLIAAEEREAVLIAQIEQDKPATTLGKLIDKATNNISMGEYAKAIGTGRQRLFDQLREQKILMPLPLNTPYQSFIERGYFVVTEKVTDRGQTFAVTLITAKGQTYLAKKRQEYLSRELATVAVEKVVDLV